MSAGRVEAIVARVGEIGANDCLFSPGAIPDGSVAFLSLPEHSLRLRNALGRCGEPVGLGRVYIVGADVVFRGRYDHTPLGCWAYRLMLDYTARPGAGWSLSVDSYDETAALVEGRSVRVIRRCLTVEVSPVLVPAYRSTRTLLPQPAAAASP
jgi:hypothetical protein